MKLTIKQKRFADEYIISGNATQAAIIAGYSKKTARSVGAENLTKPYIKNYIDERLAELEDKAIAKQAEVLKYITSVIRGEKKEQILRLNGDGVQVVTEVDVSTKDRLKAAELLGKRYGIWTDKVDVSGDMNLSIEVDYGTEDTK